LGGVGGDIGIKKGRLPHFYYCNDNQLINSNSVSSFKNNFIELLLLSPLRIQAKFIFSLTLFGNEVNLLNPIE
jgi:hypothetical protein